MTSFKNVLKPEFAWILPFLGSEYKQKEACGLLPYGRTADQSRPTPYTKTRLRNLQTSCLAIAGQSCLSATGRIALSGNC